MNYITLTQYPHNTAVLIPIDGIKLVQHNGTSTLVIIQLTNSTTKAQHVCESVADIAVLISKVSA